MHHEDIVCRQRGRALPQDNRRYAERLNAELGDATAVEQAVCAKFRHAEDTDHQRAEDAARPVNVERARRIIDLQPFKQIG